MELSSSRGQKYVVSYRPQSQAGLVVANATNAAKLEEKRDLKRRGCPVSEYDVTWDVTPGEVLVTDGRLYVLLSADVDLFRKTRISKYKVSKVDTVFYTYEIMIVPSFNMIEGGGTYHFCDETGDCYGLGVNYAQDHVVPMQASMKQHWILYCPAQQWPLCVKLKTSLPYTDTHELQIANAGPRLRCRQPCVSALK